MDCFHTFRMFRSDVVRDHGLVFMIQLLCPLEDIRLPILNHVYTKIVPSKHKSHRYYVCHWRANVGKCPYI